MAIERVTPTTSFNILEKGTTGWGTITNANWDLADNAFKADRTRITALETTSAVLPIAIATRIGHNLLRNNIFELPVPSDPALAIEWTGGTGAFRNGASGYTTRDQSTHLVGRYAQRISIVNINLAGQIRPFPGLNILELDSNGNATAPIATNDSRQLLNGFGYVFQSLQLSAKTRYTLSGYGKSEIPNNTLGINVRWKLGIVFRDTLNNIIYSHFTVPQTNLTSDISTSSFKRAELTFVSPDLPTVIAEVWLVSEGATPTSIGSSFFDGVQLEQASRATMLDTFAMRNGALFIDGDLTIGGSLKLQQDQLLLATNKVVFSGSVQIGDDITQDVLDVFTKISTFYGPVTIKGDVILGDDAYEDSFQVTAETTTFYNDQDPVTPSGGNVIVQGDFTVLGDTVLGDSSINDTVTINATLVTAGGNDIGGDLHVSGALSVDRSVELGTNHLLDGLTVNMQALGTDIYGNTRLWDDLTVAGDTVLGTSNVNSLTVNAGATVLHGDLTVDKGLTVGGPTIFDIGTGVSDNFTVNANNVTFDTVGSTVYNAVSFDLSGSLEVGVGTPSQFFQAKVPIVVLGFPATAATNTLAVHALTSTFTGSGSFGTSLTTGTTATIGGNSFVFGTNLGIPRPYVSFQRTSAITNINSISAHSGTLTFGDPEAIQLDGGGRKKYSTTAYIYAGTTYFGDPGTPGAEKVGDVQIGGDLTVAGSLTLGNSSGVTGTDNIAMTAYSLNVNVGAGKFNIGSGFQDNTYNPLVTDHGGITLDNNGNVSLDGKLTVKGPIDPISLEIRTLASTVNSIVVNDLPDGSGTNTFIVTRAGTVKATEGLVLGTLGSIASITSSAGTFGQLSSPLTSFDVYSSSSTFSSNLTVGGLASLNQLTVATSAGVSGDLTVGDDLAVVGNITATGTQFAFGSFPTSPTDFTVFADTISLGPNGYDAATVTVEGSLVVTKDAVIGTSFDSLVTMTVDTLTINPASELLLVDTLYIEQKGVRIGGGFQNRVYNDLELDHGGVTIDAYGNIFADGTISAAGPLAFNSLTLTAPDGTPLGQEIFNVLNLTPGHAGEVFRVDNLGGVRADGYMQIYDTNPDFAPSSQVDGYNVAGVFTAADGYGELSIHNTAWTEEVFQVDNFGNIVHSGQLITKYKGAATTATATVTVGTGSESHGDFNLAGPYNTSANPIGAAITYVAGLPSGKGTIYIKRGTYSLPSGGLALPAGITLVGDGEGTILSGLANSTNVGVTAITGSRIRDLAITSCTTGIATTVSTFRALIEGVQISNCITGMLLNGSRGKADKCMLDTCITGISSPGTGNVIMGCTVFGNSSTTLTGILISGTECMITANYVVDHLTDGINITGNDNIATGNVTLRNP